MNAVRDVRVDLGEPDVTSKGNSPMRSEARTDTIVEAWCGVYTFGEALHNWRQMLIAEAAKQRCRCTKKECVGILAGRGIVKTASSIRQLGWKQRVASRTEKRLLSGQMRIVSLFDPDELIRYYAKMRKGRPPGNAHTSVRRTLCGEEGQ